ncbi:MAG: hypothetical protein ACUVXA_02165 [Candidatus Jordarchaeum sp.]|uniref:hypothetical protein n=1 Tax=Candidatus Jordarchaeum sp. TaxID=2823881 RepID=UPI00404B1CF8
MRNKKLIGALLTVMVALTFSVIITLPLGTTSAYSGFNPWAANAKNSQLDANDIGAKGLFNLTVTFKTYYIQESGDLMMFVVVASTPSGLKSGLILGNGTTGWHFKPVDYYEPSITFRNLDGNVTLFIYGGLMKNVWPSGWRTVDECFGLVGAFNPLNNETGNRFLGTANGNYHMMLFLDVLISSA